MEPTGDLYGALLSIPSLAGAFVIGYVANKRRAQKRRKQIAELEAAARRQAEALAGEFPQVVASLFRSKEDLLVPTALSEAIDFLERQHAAQRWAPAPAGALLPSGSPPAPCAGLVVGGCRLVRKLGEGGMGDVYRAHHLGLDIPVALKMLRPELVRESAAVERFLVEARSAAKLRHPNIVGVYDVGCESGIYFIVMEFVEEGSLRELLGQQGRLGVPRAVALMSDVCRGLQFAHERRIIHRDIKPANILLDRQGTAKIADLGLAKRLDEDFGMTRSLTSMGTPYYLSPEQASDAKHVDHRTDIYSLGCTFYEVVCGKVPYEGDTLARIILAHARAPIPDPRVARPEISDRLAKIIMRMMGKRRDDRYPSAGAVLAELSECL
jgi:serine/threonine-protein kinase